MQRFIGTMFIYIYEQPRETKMRICTICPPAYLLYVMVISSNKVLVLFTYDVDFLVSKIFLLKEHVVIVLSWCKRLSSSKNKNFLEFFLVWQSCLHVQFLQQYNYIKEQYITTILALFDLNCKILTLFFVCVGILDVFIDIWWSNMM